MNGEEKITDTCVQSQTLLSVSQIHFSQASGLVTVRIALFVLNGWFPMNYIRRNT